MTDDRIDEAIRSVAIELAKQGHEHCDISAALIHEACAEFGWYMAESGFCSDDEAVSISCRVDKAMVATFNAATREEMEKVGRRN